MPGQYRYSINDLVSEAKRLEDMGLKSVIIFGMPLSKDEKGSSAYAKDGIVQKTVRKLKAETDLIVITDVCMKLTKRDEPIEPPICCREVIMAEPEA